MNRALTERLDAELAGFRRDGVYKKLNHLESPQASRVRMEGKGEVVILSSNNYLGLCDIPEIVQAGKEGLDRFGAGTASVRFICGTFTVHRELESALARFVGTESALTYVSCWNANEGLMPALLDEQDVVISDALNHASIIDSVRLCKARRLVYPHSDMSALSNLLREAASARTRLIVTDGVFSMEGSIAPLPQICDLAEKYNAVVVVDDSHATGFMGDTGRGTHEYHHVEDRVDVITTTFGKALGGATGGCIAGPSELIELLEQRARTSLFTNALPPVVAGATRFVLSYLQEHPELRERLWSNMRYFREKMREAGFTVPDSIHPIVPVMVGEEKAAQGMAEDMLNEGIYVIGFSYPVVPKGEARIRVQISAAHTLAQIDTLVAAFVKLGKKYQII